MPVRKSTRQKKPSQVAIEAASDPPTAEVVAVARRRAPSRAQSRVLSTWGGRGGVRGGTSKGAECEPDTPTPTPRAPARLQKRSLPEDDNPFMAKTPQRGGRIANIRLHEERLRQLCAYDGKGDSGKKGKESYNERLDAINEDAAAGNENDYLYTPYQIQPAQTRGYDGQPLSRAWIRLEVSKKDL
ncbi:hypothetical protein K469DRAFT_712892 [Zopfia rhizophila CBS 207.26]|uniref:Uncharacterized protein n=1 Tax=Zopfia rhizophila CBS 207.26 TaxID=1314779 RepID=A0A6A6DRM4_9PEZI|nr:hypothetical protein K469DRAFT_712892 [Zopfia rhizophila CBS 207.26]